MADYNDLRDPFKLRDDLSFVYDNLTRTIVWYDGDEKLDVRGAFSSVVASNGLTTVTGSSTTVFGDQRISFKPNALSAGTWEVQARLSFDGITATAEWTQTVEASYGPVPTPPGEISGAGGATLQLAVSVVVAAGGFSLAPAAAPAVSFKAENPVGALLRLDQAGGGSLAFRSSSTVAASGFDLTGAGGGEVTGQLGNIVGYTLDLVGVGGGALELGPVSSEIGAAFELEGVAGGLVTGNIEVEQSTGISLNLLGAAGGVLSLGPISAEVGAALDYAASGLPSIDMQVSPLIDASGMDLQGAAGGQYTGALGGVSEATLDLQGAGGGAVSGGLLVPVGASLNLSGAGGGAVTGTIVSAELATASVFNLSRDRSIFDGDVYGGSGADIPLTGTTTATPGTAINARAVAETSGNVVADWREIGTALWGDFVMANFATLEDLRDAIHSGTVHVGAVSNLAAMQDGAAWCAEHGVSIVNGRVQLNTGSYPDVVQKVDFSNLILADGPSGKTLFDCYIGQTRFESGRGSLLSFCTFASDIPFGDPTKQSLWYQSVGTGKNAVIGCDFTPSRGDQLKASGSDLILFNRSDCPITVDRDPVVYVPGSTYEIGDIVRQSSDHAGTQFVYRNTVASNTSGPVSFRNTSGTDANGWEAINPHSDNFNFWYDLNGVKMVGNVINHDPNNRYCGVTGRLSGNNAGLWTGGAASEGPNGAKNLFAGNTVYLQDTDGNPSPGLRIPNEGQITDCTIIAHPNRNIWSKDSSFKIARNFAADGTTEIDLTYAQADHTVTVDNTLPVMDLAAAFALAEAEVPQLGAAEYPWFGTLAGVPVTADWLFPNALPAGSTAAPGVSTYRFASGIVVIEEDQSNTEQGYNPFLDDLYREQGFEYQTTIPAWDLQYSYVLPRGQTNKEGAHAPRSLHNTSDWNEITTSMRFKAQVLRDAAPGIKMMWGIMGRSGTIASELLDDGGNPEYRWDKVVQNGRTGLVDVLKADGSMIGTFLFDHGTGMVKEGPRDDERRALTAAVFGTDINGNLVVPSQTERFAGSPIPLIDGGSRTFNHIFAHAMPELLTGRGRWLMGYAKGALPATGDGSNPNSAPDNFGLEYGHPYDTPYITARTLPVHTMPLAVVQPWSVAGNDVDVHYAGEDLRGMPLNWGGKMYMVLSSLGQVTALAPKLDYFDWATDGTYVIVGVTGQAITTQERIEAAAEARSPVNWPVDTEAVPLVEDTSEVLGFVIKDAAGDYHRAEVEIVDIAGTPDPAGGYLKITDPLGQTYPRIYWHRDDSIGPTFEGPTLYKNWIGASGSAAGHWARHHPVVVDPNFPSQPYGGVTLHPPDDPEELATSAVIAENGAMDGVSFALGDPDYDGITNDDGFAIADRLTIEVKYNNPLTESPRIFDTDQGSSFTYLFMDYSDDTLKFRLDGGATNHLVYDPGALGDPSLFGTNTALLFHYYNDGSGPAAAVYRDLDGNGTYTLRGSPVAIPGGGRINYNDRMQFFSGTGNINLSRVRVKLSSWHTQDATPLSVVDFGIEMAANNVPTDDDAAADGHAPVIKGYTPAGLFALSGNFYENAAGSGSLATFSGISQTATSMAFEMDLAALKENSLGIMSSDGGAKGPGTLILTLFTSPQIVADVDDIRFNYDTRVSPILGSAPDDPVHFQQLKVYGEVSTTTNRVRFWRDFGAGYVLVFDETNTGTGTVTFASPQIILPMSAGGDVKETPVLINYARFWLDPSSLTGSPPSENVTFGVENVGGVTTPLTNYAP